VPIIGLAKCIVAHPTKILGGPSTLQRPHEIMFELVQCSMTRVTWRMSPCDVNVALLS